MTKASIKLQPANWQVTATSLFCDSVDDFVTIIVNKDWTTKCCWYNQNCSHGTDYKRQKLDKTNGLKMKKCSGPECSYAINYRDKLIHEERGAK